MLSLVVNPCRGCDIPLPRLLCLAVNTNDGFFGINSMIPDIEGSVVKADAFDAGKDAYRIVQGTTGRTNPVYVPVPFSTLYPFTNYFSPWTHLSFRHVAPRQRKLHMYFLYNRGATPPHWSVLHSYV